jgi:hypothetical protein
MFVSIIFENVLSNFLVCRPFWFVKSDAAVILIGVGPKAIAERFPVDVNIEITHSALVSAFQEYFLQLL